MDDLLTEPIPLEFWKLWFLLMIKNRQSYQSFIGVCHYVHE